MVGTEDSEPEPKSESESKEVFFQLTRTELEITLVEMSEKSRNSRKNT